MRCFIEILLILQILSVSFHTGESITCDGSCKKNADCTGKLIVGSLLPTKTSETEEACRCEKLKCVSMKKGQCGGACDTNSDCSDWANSADCICDLGTSNCKMKPQLDKATDLARKEAQQNSTTQPDQRTRKAPIQ